MLMHHIIAVRSSPGHEISEIMVPDPELVRRMTALKRDYQTIFVYRSFIGTKPRQGDAPSFSP